MDKNINLQLNRPNDKDIKKEKYISNSKSNQSDISIEIDKYIFTINHRFNYHDYDIVCFTSKQNNESSSFYCYSSFSEGGIFRLASRSNMKILDKSSRNIGWIKGSHYITSSMIHHLIQKLIYDNWNNIPKFDNTPDTFINDVTCCFIDPTYTDDIDEIYSPDDNGLVDLTSSRISTSNECENKYFSKISFKNCRGYFTTYISFKTKKACSLYSHLYNRERFTENNILRPLSIESSINNISCDNIIKKLSKDKYKNSQFCVEFGNNLKRKCDENTPSKIIDHIRIFFETSSEYLEKYYNVVSNNYLTTTKISVPDEFVITTELSICELKLKDIYDNYDNNNNNKIFILHGNYILENLKINKKCHGPYIINIFPNISVSKYGTYKNIFNTGVYTYKILDYDSQIKQYMKDQNNLRKSLEFRNLKKGTNTDVQYLFIGDIYNYDMFPFKCFNNHDNNNIMLNCNDLTSSYYKGGNKYYKKYLKYKSKYLNYNKIFKLQ